MTTERHNRARENIVAASAVGIALFIDGSSSQADVAPPFNPIGASMMTIASRTAAAIAFTSLLLMSSAYAQATAPAAAPAATEKKAEKPRSAASLECSKEADAKGLHGKERKKFRADCKKEATAKPK
jgi:CelD/BcsL family acetyltransferase involved in cellulose biosynthesis